MSWIHALQQFVGSSAKRGRLRTRPESIDAAPRSSVAGSPRVDWIAAITIPPERSIRLLGQILNPPAQAELTLTVNWGDRLVQDYSLEAGGGAFNLDHQYADQRGATTPSVDQRSARPSIRLTLIDEQRDEVVDSAVVERPMLGMWSDPPMSSPPARPACWVDRVVDWGAQAGSAGVAPVRLPVLVTAASGWESPAGASGEWLVAAGASLPAAADSACRRQGWPAGGLNPSAVGGSLRQQSRG